MDDKRGVILQNENTQQQIYLVKSVSKQWTPYTVVIQCGADKLLNQMRLEMHQPIGQYNLQLKILARCVFITIY